MVQNSILDFSEFLYYAALIGSS